MFGFLVYGYIGLFSGLHSACWGSYKDSLYEKFKLSKFLRSLAVGFLLGALLPLLMNLNGHLSVNLGLFFAIVVSLERMFTEFLKAFIRREDQAKYHIPSAFHMFGKVVEKHSSRLLLGACAVLLILLLLPIVNTVRFQGRLLIGVAGGLFAGLLVAIGGAWKDAPFEGFEPSKFLRSPLVSGVWGGVFCFLSSEFCFLLLACMGAERMTVELYKAFIAGSRPGKFKQDKPTYTDWLVKRKAMIIPYMLTWAIFFILLSITTI